MSATAIPFTPLLTCVIEVDALQLDGTRFPLEAGPHHPA